jgi:hypothetical protein
MAEGGEGGLEGEFLVEDVEQIVKVVRLAILNAMGLKCCSPAVYAGFAKYTQRC